MTEANRAAAGLVRAARHYRDGQAFADAIRTQCAGLNSTETAHVVGALALAVVAVHEGADLDRVLAHLEGGAR